MSNKTEIDLENAIKILKSDENGNYVSIDELLNEHKKIISKSYRILYISILFFTFLLSFSFFKVLISLLALHPSGMTLLLGTIFSIYCFIMFYNRNDEVDDNNSLIEEKLKKSSSSFEFFNQKTFNWFYKHNITKYFNKDFMLLLNATDKDYIFRIIGLIKLNMDNKSFKNISNYINLCQQKKNNFNIMVFESFCLKQNNIGLIDTINENVKKATELIEWIESSNIENDFNFNLNYSKYHAIKDKYQHYNTIQDENDLIEFNSELCYFYNSFCKNINKIKLMIEIKQKLDLNDMAKSNFHNQFIKFSEIIDDVEINDILLFKNKLDLYTR